MEQITGNLTFNAHQVSGGINIDEHPITGNVVLGAQPIQGSLSSLGIRGFSAYELAVQNGFVGTEVEWLETLKGRVETKYENNIVYFRDKHETEWHVMLNMTAFNNSIAALQSGKVDKQTGYSLLADTEIARLATLHNYNDSTLIGSISQLSTQLQNLSSAHDDDIDEINDELESKISYPEEDGAAGDVLTVNEDGSVEWYTPQKVSMSVVNNTLNISIDGAPDVSLNTNGGVVLERTGTTINESGGIRINSGKINLDDNGGLSF